MIRSVMIAAALIALPVHSAESPRKPTKAELVAMSVPAEDAASRVKITGLDELDPSVWVSTEPFLKGPVDDKFFRAMIDKATGEVTYQIYFRSTSSRGPLRLQKGTYLVDGQLKAVSIERIGGDVSCRQGGCTHFEDFVADIPRADLEALTAEAAASSPSWRMRLFADAIGGSDTEFLRNETRGFLIAVDRQRATLGFSATEPASATAAASDR